LNKRSSDCQPSSVRLNYGRCRLRVEWTSDEFEPTKIIDVLHGLGYQAHPFLIADSESSEADEMHWLLRCLAIAGFAAMNVMLLSVSVWAGNATRMGTETRDFFHWLSALITLPAAAFAGQPFFISAFAAIRSRRLNMDVPISVGVTVTLLMSVIETLHHATHAYFDFRHHAVVFSFSGSRS
jgi:Cu2+-exporting ATPase